MDIHCASIRTHLWTKHLRHTLRTAIFKTLREGLYDYARHEMPARVVLNEGKSRSGGVVPRMCQLNFARCFTSSTGCGSTTVRETMQIVLAD